MNCFHILTAHSILFGHHFFDNLILNLDQVEIVDLVLEKEDGTSICKAEVVELHAIVVTVQKRELGSERPKLELGASDTS